MLKRLSKTTEHTNNHPIRVLNHTLVRQIPTVSASNVVIPSASPTLLDSTELEADVVSPLLQALAVGWKNGPVGIKEGDLFIRR